jgi:hypothetical protein
MSGNGRPTTKDYVDMAVNGTREVFKQELLVLKNDILNTVDGKIVVHNNVCQDKRTKEKDTIVLSKKQILAITGGMFTSGTVGMVIQYIYKLWSG